MTKTKLVIKFDENLSVSSEIQKPLVLDNEQDAIAALSERGFINCEFDLTCNYFRCYIGGHKCKGEAFWATYL